MSSELNHILEKAGKGNGLLPEEAVEIFDHASLPEWERVFQTACQLTRRNFGKELIFFAPLYFSNRCVNDCRYCGFRRSNLEIARRVLSEEEFFSEAQSLWDAGHRTVLLIAGEHPHDASAARIASYVGQLRERGLSFFVMLEIAPLPIRDYELLRRAGVKQVLLFQETYDRSVYEQVHDGPKRNYEWRRGAMARALQGGIKRVGLGALLGLGDYREDFLELLRHAWQLRNSCGVFPSTLSFPRLRPAFGVTDFNPPHPVSDDTLRKMMAVTRLALPFTGIVLTTRESPELRDYFLSREIGVTHVSAGSSTQPGGYSLYKEEPEGQFSMLDSRPLAAVAKQVEEMGYTPAF